jgi:hypothetical protein
MTDDEINQALAASGIEILIGYDYIPSTSMEMAVYQALDFRERFWRSALLSATGRNRMTRQLSETQSALRLVASGGAVAGLRIKVLTSEAARNLQRAGFRLQAARKPPAFQTEMQSTDMNERDQ